MPGTMEIWATGLFALAIGHTFSVKRFQHWAGRYPSGSVAENFFHLLGEVEVVFWLWAGVLFCGMVWLQGYEQAVHYIDSLDFTEPAFVFVIMAVAATRPVIQLANSAILWTARVIPIPGQAAFVFSALVLGPLLGSFITEPAAMTVTALLLKDRLFLAPGISKRVKYLALGILFVNVSIGGVMTPYAAPPVLMVADTWGWDFSYMFAHFGYKAVIAVVLNAGLLLSLSWNELSTAPLEAQEKGNRTPAPFWLVAVHGVFLGLVVVNAHHVAIFLALFLFFLGIVNVTQEHQGEVKLRESLLVAAFLSGLVVMGGLQQWWLQPLLTRLSETTLFLGATALTAVTDNAALTFLGSQVEGLAEGLKYALVSGAVAGGGLTVIANAPNPAGYSILHKCFGSEGISPLGLFAGAAIPTLVAMLAFWLLPNISV